MEETKVCYKCKRELLLDIQCADLPSRRRWFLGHFCSHCGILYRATGNFESAEAAQDALDAWVLDLVIPEEANETS